MFCLSRFTEIKNKNNLYIFERDNTESSHRFYLCRYDNFHNQFVPVASSDFPKSGLFVSKSDPSYVSQARTLKYTTNLFNKYMRAG